MKVEVTAPKEFQGPVGSSLAKKHGLIIGQDADTEYFTLTAEVQYYRIRWAINY